MRMAHALLNLRRAARGRTRETVKASSVAICTAGRWHMASKTVENQENRYHRCRLPVPAAGAPPFAAGFVLTA
jgi:hypothetical protein